MMSYRFFWVLIFQVLLFSGCDKAGISEAYSKIDSNGWPAEVIQTFTFEITEPAMLHNVWLAIRNDNSYSYSNLWLFVKLVPPSGAVVTDTVQILLADNRGRWLGKGFAGVFESRYALRQQFIFPEKGTYSLEIQQGMRAASLKGITHVGLRVELVAQ